MRSSTTRILARHRTATDIITELRQFTKTTDLDNGRRVHQDAVASGCQNNKYVAAALITLYRKCRRMALAREVFDKLLTKDVATWNSLLLGYVDNGQSAVALDLFFNSMTSEPDHVTYLAALKACTVLASSNPSEKPTCLEKGMTLHKQASAQKLDSNLAVANTLIDMYSKLGNMLRAQKVFNQMTNRNVVSWNCLILGYMENSESAIAMSVFRSMDCEPDPVSFLGALKACIGLLDVEERLVCLRRGEEIHREITRRGFDSGIVVASTLIDMYSKCGSMEQARDVFNRMSRRNAVTWTCIILGYVENGESSAALEMFLSMDCEPDSVAFLAALKACGNIASEKEPSEKNRFLEKGIEIHRRVQTLGLPASTVLSNALICMYCRCGSTQRARDVFECMPRKDVVSWTTLMVGYVENGESSAALEVLASMDCEPNAVTFLAAVRACASLALLERGMELHSQAENRGFDRDIHVANALLDMYTRCGAMQRTIDVFERMSCERNTFSYVTVLKACAGSSALSFGRNLHARVCELGLEGDQAIATALVDFYSKCGLMLSAEHVFDGMVSHCVVSWTALTSGFSSLGNSCRVFELARRIEEASVEMNGVTFVCILTACSHAGLVDQGKKYFRLMSDRYGVTPRVEHYNCMVDILGRANQLEEALSFIKSMPAKVVDHVTWMTLLAACRKWKNFRVGKVAFDALAAATSNGDSGAPYVLMSDIYRNVSS